MPITWSSSKIQAWNFHHTLCYVRAGNCANLRPITCLCQTLCVGVVSIFDVCGRPLIANPVTFGVYCLQIFFYLCRMCVCITLGMCMRMCVHACMCVVMCYQSHVVTGTSSDLVVHVKSSEFTDFSKHPGCATGEHVWKPTGEETAATQLCRSVAPPLNIIHYYCKELPLCFTYSRLSYCAK